MVVEEIVLEKFRHLPPEQQREVLDFVEFLEFKHGITLEEAIAQIRERSGSIKSEELEVLVEEARQDFHASRHNDPSPS